jgi:hypothetical protein
MDAVRVLVGLAMFQAPFGSWLGWAGCFRIPFGRLPDWKVGLVDINVFAPSNTKREQ